MYKKELIKSVAEKIKEAGFRVWISGTGEYGIFTDKKGESVVYFQTDFSAVVFSGTYKPLKGAGKTIGTGWRMEGVVDLSKSTLKKLVAARAPYWAAKHDQYELNKIEDYLERNKHSGYKEL